jgi:hypothetical protein
MVNWPSFLRPLGLDRPELREEVETCTHIQSKAFITDTFSTSTFSGTGTTKSNSCKDRHDYRASFEVSD